ncbi:MAG: hypothetical protein M1832_001562 [Thelocarpon impressellum]|nr:MAG: hypothetical protein M1832_001562 [Thelocarpon impressellum]
MSPSHAHIPAGDDSPIARWASIIGIVTAIVGNILISFALNIQRYAHTRLSKERKRRVWTPYGTSRPVSAYGTEPGDGDEGTVRRNGGPSTDHDLHVPRTRHCAEAHADAAEDDPLFPLPSSRHSSGNLSVKSERSSSSDSRETYLRSPYWWAGILLMTVGEAGNFLAYGFAPASIVSPLGVVALVSNCVIAPIMLKEHFRRQDFAGVLVAIAGAVTVVLSAKTSETKLGPDEIIVAITRWEFALYFGITVSLILAGMWASRRYGDRTILIDLGLVGLFGGYTALSTKGVASLLSYTLWRALTFPITYILILVLISTALLQIKYVNRALQRFDSTQVIPTQFVLFTLSVIVGSAILYRDFEQADASRMMKFLSGCALTFVGVWMITSGRGGNLEDDDDDGAGHEQRINLIDTEQPEYDEEDSLEGDAQVARPPAKGRARQFSRTSRKGLFDETITPPLTMKTSPNGRVRPVANVSRRGISEVFARPPTDADTLETGKQRSHNLATRHSSAPAALTPAPASEGAPTPDGSSASRPGRPSEDSSRSSPEMDVVAPKASAKSAATHPDMLGTGAPQTFGRSDSEPAVLQAGSSSRKSTLSRRSMSRMLPGPYMSPLSGSLSAMVAESLRREAVDLSSSQRRAAGLSEESLSGRTETGRKRSHSSIPATGQHPLLDRASSFKRARTPDGRVEVAGKASPRSRMALQGMARSLSTRVSGLIRIKKRGDREGSHGRGRRGGADGA